MKKAWIAIIVVTLVGGAGVWWFLTNKATAPSEGVTLPGTTTVQSEPSASTPSDANDVQSGTVTVDMKNTAYSPASIKIKKGTKVVWTNQDSIRHNVVADASNSNGLPTENDLVGKGQTYTFTFNTVGTVKYHCTPHPFMAGTIEVVE